MSRNSHLEQLDKLVYHIVSDQSNFFLFDQGSSGLCTRNIEPKNDCYLSIVKNN